MPEETHSQPVNSYLASRDGQYDEFVVLLTRNDLAIRRFVRFLLPTSEGVDDVVQETALECWKKYSEFQPVGDAQEEFARWACVIARYKAMSWQRDRSRDRLVFHDAVVEQLSQDALDIALSSSERQLAVEKCLDELPADQRRLVLSVHATGDSVAKIARETGQKSRRLYSTINSLRALLLTCVQRRLAEEI